MKKAYRSSDTLWEKLSEKFGDFDYVVLETPMTPPASETLVVTANGIPALTQAWFMPEKKYELWALSHATARAISELLSLPEEAIGVVDRYELFPVTATPIPLEATNAFVYAGRLVPEKNFQHLLSFVKDLQALKAFRDHELFLCGYPNPGKGPYRYLGDLGKNWTAHRSLKTAAFITMSTYRFEDFSVAAAEAQAAGLPVICPEWQAFRDLEGQVYTVPAGPLFGEKRLPRSFRRELAPKTTGALRPREARKIPGRTLNRNIGRLPQLEKNRCYAYFNSALFPATHAFFRKYHSLL